MFDCTRELYERMTGRRAPTTQAVVDVRIERLPFALMAHQLLELGELQTVTAHPPASGPEVEATFGPFDDFDNAEAIVTAALARLRLTPLAIRTRTVVA